MSKSGPKPMKINPYHRRQVRFWAASGISRPTIARMLKMDVRTLNKYFAEELDSGAEMELATNLDRLRTAADKGSVPAMRFLHQKLETTMTDAVIQNGFAQPAPEPAKPLGKKQQALVDAQNAGKNEADGWGNDLDVPVIRTVN